MYTQDVRQAAKLQPIAQLYVCSHKMYPCVIIDLHATLACQDSNSIFYTKEINGIYILEMLLLEWLLAYYFVSLFRVPNYGYFFGSGIILKFHLFNVK